MDGCYADLWKERRNRDCTPRRIAAKKELLKNAQLDVAKFTKMVIDCEIRIQDVDVVPTTEHKIRHAKFAAVDTLTAWVSTNPNVCVVTISNTLAVNPTFPSSVPVRRSAGLASERYATLGTLESWRLEVEENIKENCTNLDFFCWTPTTILDNNCVDRFYICDWHWMAGLIVTVFLLFITQYACWKII